MPQPPQPVASPLPPPLPIPAQPPFQPPTQPQGAQDDGTGQRGVQLLLEAQRSVVGTIASGQRLSPSNLPPPGWQRERAQGSPEVSIDRPGDWQGQMLAIRAQGNLSSVQARLGSADGRHLLLGRLDMMQRTERSARQLAEQEAAPHAGLGFVREITRLDWQDAGPGGYTAVSASFTAYEMRDYIIVTMATVVTVPQLEALGMSTGTVFSKLLIGPKVVFSSSAASIYAPMLASATW